MDAVGLASSVVGDPALAGGAVDLLHAPGQADRVRAVPGSVGLLLPAGERLGVARPLEHLLEDGHLEARGRMVAE